MLLKALRTTDRCGLMLLVALLSLPALVLAEPAKPSVRVGFAEADITPPQGFPMAGYYHERLAEGTIDPLKAKAIYLQEGDTQFVLVVCDLIGIATDLSKTVREKAAEATGIPASNMVIAATHSHTAPDYMKELYLKLRSEKQQQERAEYIDKLISSIVDTIGQAKRAAAPSRLQSGSAVQETPVAFNRRFVMRDGSVRTWASFDNPEVVRSAGPIDPEIGSLTVADEQGKLRGVVSNFALHLDTVGGMKWSADYPYFIQQTIRERLGDDVFSLFGTGTCGDINHANPRATTRNKVDFIGNSLGSTIVEGVGKLQPLVNPSMVVKSRVVKLPLQDATKAEVDRAIEVIGAAQRKEKVDFYEHVSAYRKLMLDQMRHKQPHAKADQMITWGLSRSLAGIGDTLPVDVTVMTLGQDFAIVCLPGEVFVELGLAIKQLSPCRTTLVIELANTVETIYIPTRAAYAGGGYEVTNSSLQPGSGEMLVEASIGLLREAASEKGAAPAAK